VPWPVEQPPSSPPDATTEGPAKSASGPNRPPGDPASPRLERVLSSHFKIVLLVNVSQTDQGVSDTFVESFQ
jgi:hypothetical protein